MRSFHIDGANRPEIRPVMDGNIHKATRVFTDGAQYYRFMPVAQHETVDHSKGEYVRYTKSGKIHTNTVEGVFSIFRRGMVGTYQHCGEQHLHRYLAEFDFRYSNRAKLGIDDAARAEIALKGIEENASPIGGLCRPKHLAQQITGFIRWRRKNGFPVTPKRRLH